MKLNKKGMTLVELIISIALISVILGFLFKILLDVKYETQNAGYAINNQINRAEIINFIEEEIKEKQLNLVYKWHYYNYGQFELRYDNPMITGYLETRDDHKSLIYRHSITNDAGEEDITFRKWTIKDEGYRYGEFSLERIGSCYLMLRIPVIRDNEENNPVDDIEILVKLTQCG